MTYVYGSATVEPEGFELAEKWRQAPCPRCDRPARHGRVERAEGSLNIYHPVTCRHCGYRTGFDWQEP